MGLGTLCFWPLGRFAFSPCRTTKNQSLRPTTNNLRLTTKYHMTVIKVENVSKRYRIGVQEKSDTFAGQLKNAITYPVRNFKRITQLKNLTMKMIPQYFGH